MKGIERFVSDPLGFEFMPQRKEWIMTAASTVLGTLGSLFGGGAAARAQQESIAHQKELYKQNYAQALRDYNQSALDRADNQALLSRAEKFNMKNWRRAQGAKAVGGGTDAAVQMQKDVGNEMMASTIGNIAASNAARKDAASARMQQANAQHANIMSQEAQNRAQQITNAASAASNAIMQAGSAFESSTNLKGGENKGVETNGSAVQMNNIKAPSSSNIGKRYNGMGVELVEDLV